MPRSGCSVLHGVNPTLKKNGIWTVQVFCHLGIILEYMLIIICFSFSRCYKQLPLFCLLQYRSIGKMLLKKTRWEQLWNLCSRYHFPYWGSIWQIQNRIKKYLHFNDIDNLEFPWFWEISFVTKLSWNSI